MYFHVLLQASALLLSFVPCTLSHPLDQEDPSITARAAITAAPEQPLKPRSQLPGGSGTCIVYVNARDIGSSTTRTFAALPKPGDPEPTPCERDPGAASKHKRTVLVDPDSITSALIYPPTSEPAIDPYQPGRHLNDLRRAVETTLATVIRRSARLGERQDEDPVAVPPTPTTQTHTKKQPTGWLNARATVLERDDAPEPTLSSSTSSNTGIGVFVNARATALERRDAPEPTHSSYVNARRTMMMERRDAPKSTPSSYVNARRTVMERRDAPEPTHSSYVNARRTILEARDAPESTPSPSTSSNIGIGVFVNARRTILERSESPEPTTSSSTSSNTGIGVIVNARATMLERDDAPEPTSSPFTTSNTGIGVIVNARATMLERDDAPEPTASPFTFSYTGPAVIVNARATSNGRK